MVLRDRPTLDQYLIEEKIILYKRYIKEASITYYNYKKIGYYITNYRAPAKLDTNKTIISNNKVKPRYKLNNSRVYTNYRDRVEYSSLGLSIGNSFIEAYLSPIRLQY